MRTQTYSTGIVSENVDQAVVGAQLFLPRLRREGVVDGNNVDAGDALGGEGVGVLNVAGDLRRARRSEGAGNANNDDCRRGTGSMVSSITFSDRNLSNSLRTLAGQTVE